jgi:hypothetical protein
LVVTNKLTFLTDGSVNPRCYAVKHNLVVLKTLESSVKL